MTYILHMISCRTKRLHARSHMNRIFSRVVFWRGSWMFRFFPLCLCGAGHRQSGVTLNGNPKGRTTLKMGFPFAGGYLPRRKFIWSENLLFSFLFSFIDRELFCFPPIFSFLLSSDLWSGILLFLSFSFFSFSSDLWLGIQILAFVIRSPLMRFCCPVLRGKDEDSLHRARFKVA